MERLWDEGWKSHAGGQLEAFFGICRGVVVNAAVGRAGRPEGGRRGRGVALTEQSVQEVIAWTCLEAQGL